MCQNEPTPDLHRMQLAVAPRSAFLYKTVHKLKSAMQRLEFESTLDALEHTIALQPEGWQKEEPLPGLPDTYFRFAEKDGYKYYVHCNTGKEMIVCVQSDDCASFEAYVESCDPWPKGWIPGTCGGHWYWYDGSLHIHPASIYGGKAAGIGEAELEAAMLIALPDDDHDESFD